MMQRPRAKITYGDQGKVIRSVIGGRAGAASDPERQFRFSERMTALQRELMALVILI